VCPDCKREVFVSQPQNIADILFKEALDREVWVLFKIPLAKRGNRYLKEFLPELERQGFREFLSKGRLTGSADLIKAGLQEEFLRVCADRLTAAPKNRKRLLDSLETAFRYGKGEVEIRAGKQTFQFAEGLRCFTCGRNFREPSPNLFSFNSPLGACTPCQGFGRVITLDWNLVVPDVSKTIAAGVIEPWTKPSSADEFKGLLAFCKRKGIPVQKPWQELTEKQREMILRGVKGDRYSSVADYFTFLETKTYKMHVRIFLSKYRCFVPCTACGQTRLKPEALWVQVAGKNVAELQTFSLTRLMEFFAQLPLAGSELEKVEPVYLEIKRRLRFLNEVGLGYLSLGRLSRTLSGGEVQRIHLATSLGSALVDTLYVLDEPSVGLHERDNHLLIRLLKELRDLGNTVVVVEHDRTMIEAADEVVDLGPGGGEKGGRILFQGALEDLKASQESLTGQYLSGRKNVKRRNRAERKAGAWIRIRGASEHNLKNVDVDIPLGQFVVITGVSGSGKSTLLYDVLYHQFLRHRGQPVQDVGAVRSIKGFENVDEIVLIDQSPIGRTPRSNPATYLKAFDEVRKIFAGQPEARRQGYGPGYFSFNVDGGRCPVCKGDGRVKVEMHFLADIYLPCEECHGKRFKPEILEIRCRGKNIDEVLGLTIDDAAEFFSAERTLVDKLAIMQKVGLGYLRLGQPATTLSGGEAQRLKLAFEMTERHARHILYLFDEPTTGLHYHDIHYLMEALDELIERRHSLVIIEHNMEIIRSADYLIDLGPEGGEGGGRLVYSGPAAGILKSADSYTGRYLRDHLETLAGSEAKV